ncbi:MAG: divalent-cation tolerance protein CutA [Syntrophorhabdaceae bacterium]|nr:divalent-cation tolerance protein CutA [Syntrophorhabdaceae bacterium]
MQDIIQVVTTVSTVEEAEKIGRHLVDQKLASCVQIVGPIKSIYRWKGQMEEAQEWQCIIKTKKYLYKACEEMILSLHSYELPEIVSFSIHTALAGYALWIHEETL